MMADTTIIIDSISSVSPYGTRDIAFDFTNALETSEIISSAEVTSSDSALLSIVSAEANTAPITKSDGGTIAANKGVQVQIAALAEVKKRKILISIRITGDSGTRETYEASIDVVDKKRA